METTLYNDQEQTAVKNLKRAMTLDFNGPSGQSKKQKIQTALLQSPDLNMLKLASPELERMIIQANGMVTTTPTPTQFLFPKVITEEQEAYAQGFVAALEELQREKSKNFSTLNTVSSSNVSSANVITAADGSVDLTSQPNLNFTYAPVSNDSSHIFTTTTSLPGGLVTFSNPSEVSTSGQYSQSLKLTKIKEEPQTVPSGLNSPPLSPIDMENQEVIKLERKRARNRVAARKCRTRKLERIARLEDKVKDLKGQNNDLSNTASKLRDEVCQLKRTIIGHVNTGCQIMMTNNITF